MKTRNSNPSRWSDPDEGGAGRDTLNGGAGNDALNGGDHSDTASYADAAAAVMVSLAIATPQNTVGAGTDTLTSIENLTGSGFNDTMVGDGGDNVLNGGGGTDRASYAAAGAGVTVRLALATAQDTIGAGTDTLLSIESLFGSAFNDILTGDGAANVLIGGNGIDTLDGGGGNDTLRGMAGADVLTGGAGADVFDFDTLADSGITGLTRDTITDFLPGAGDRIDLSTIDANAGADGNNAFRFIGAAAFSASNASGQLRFDAVNHLLLGSTDADGAAEFSILLTGINSMTVGNFIL